MLRRVPALSYIACFMIYQALSSPLCVMTGHPEYMLYLDDEKISEDVHTALHGFVRPFSSALFALSGRHQYLSPPPCITAVTKQAALLLLSLFKFEPKYMEAPPSLGNVMVSTSYYLILIY
jgi:hypothetical protein